MKTNQELLDFYGVELGKEYKIIKPCRQLNGWLGSTFVINGDPVEMEITDTTGETYDRDINFLAYISYEEVKPEPLTDEERDYLRAVIKPFRDQIVYIAKNFTIFTNNQYIGIYIKDQDTTYLPVFPEGKYYKGMEVNKEYTLEDLGL